MAQQEKRSIADAVTANERLARLEAHAIALIRAFIRNFRAQPSVDGNAALAAARESCAYQEAYAIMAGIEYEETKAYLHRKSSEAQNDEA